MPSHQVLFFAVGVIDVLVMFFTDLKPNNIALAHGQESGSDEVMALFICHLELVSYFASLIEINELPIIKSCAVHVIYDVSRFDTSLKFGLGLFDEVLD